MTFDFTNLAPDPWEVEHRMIKSPEETHCVVVDANGKALFDGLNSDTAVIGKVHDDDAVGYYDRGSYDNLAFAALARNAFSVMVRRGWGVYRSAIDGKWQVDARIGVHIQAIAVREAFAKGFDEPFTALVSLDQWYAENVEPPCLRTPPSPPHP